MKALSLWQPWASLLAHGLKRVETRGSSLKYRGPLLIHAAKKWDGSLIRLCDQEPFRSAIISTGAKVSTDLPLGAIVGRVNVVECYRTEDVDFDSELDVTPLDPVWQYAQGKLRLWHEQRAFGDYGAGRFAILCDNFVVFPKPVPYRGAQGMFDVPESLIPEAA